MGAGAVGIAGPATEEPGPRVSTPWTSPRGSSIDCGFAQSSGSTRKDYVAAKAN